METLVGSHRNIALFFVCLYDDCARILHCRMLCCENRLFSKRCSQQNLSIFADPPLSGR